MKVQKGKLSAEEILEVEQSVDARKQGRSGGFKLMSVRDAGSARLSNGASMHWPVPRPDVRLDPGEFYVYPMTVPEGHFALVIDGEKYVFDTEDFRKYLRWA